MEFKNGNFDMNSKDIEHDLAIVKFPAGSAQEFLKLTQTDPQNDDNFIIVGFGDQNGDHLKKRIQLS